MLQAGHHTRDSSDGSETQSTSSALMILVVFENGWVVFFTFSACRIVDRFFIENGRKTVAENGEKNRCVARAENGKKTVRTRFENGENVELKTENNGVRTRPENGAAQSTRPRGEEEQQEG